MASEYIEDKHKLKGVRFMLLVVATINSIVAIIFGIISSFFENSIPIYINTFIAGVVAYIIPIVIYAHTNKVTSAVAAERYYLKKCNELYIVLVAVMGICWQFVMGVINLPMNLMIGSSEGYYFNSLGELFAAVIVIGVIPAFFEEFLFRGIVYGSMAELNIKAATVFSSAMFALLHADICAIVGYFFMGIVLTDIVSRTKSLYAAMAFHFANNLTAMLLVYFNSYLQYEPFLTIVLFIAGIIGFVILYMLLIMLKKRTDSVCRLKTSHLLGQSFVNIPVLLCVAVVVITAMIMRIL